jgi:hypothetical protein
MRETFRLAIASAGKSIAASTAIKAMTTNTSIFVMPRREIAGFSFISFLS